MSFEQICSKFLPAVDIEKSIIPVLECRIPHGMDKTKGIYKIGQFLESCSHPQKASWKKLSFRDRFIRIHGVLKSIKTSGKVSEAELKSLIPFNGSSRDVAIVDDYIGESFDDSDDSDDEQVEYDAYGNAI
jgi:hypothetical protein